MDIQLEKKKGIQKKHIPYIAGGAVVLFLLIWIIFGNHASTLRIEGDALNIADVTYGEFNDYIRLNGQVQPISIVQLSPEEGGIVQEKVVEEGAHVKKGDIILRLSNSNLDLQILNAESELAEKQNLLRNTQVTMQQDKLNNETEKVDSSAAKSSCKRKKTTRWHRKNTDSSANASSKTLSTAPSKWTKWKTTSTTCGRTSSSSANAKTNWKCAPR